MKHRASILLAILFAVVLMQLCRANVELKCNYETLAWQVQNENDQFKACIAANYQRTHRDAQKIAELEAKIKTLTAAPSRTN